MAASVFAAGADVQRAFPGLLKTESVLHVNPPPTETNIFKDHLCMVLKTNPCLRIFRPMLSNNSVAWAPQPHRVPYILEDF